MVIEFFRENLWAFLVLFYALVKGAREIIKKKALQTNSVMEVLVVYTLLSFVLVSPTVVTAIDVTWWQLFLIFLKSFVICISWIFGYKAVSQLSVSLYGVIDMSRMVFTTLLSVVFLSETLSWGQGIGLVIVMVGIALLQLKKEPMQNDGTATKRTATAFVLMAFASNFLNGVSSTLDKIIMTTENMDSTKLQFWYMGFLTLLYFGYVLGARKKLNWKSAFTNKWIWILAVIFILADKALFAANGMNTTVVGMTILKQSCVLVTVLGGKIFYHEKNILYKLFCAAVVIAGVVLSVFM